MKKVKEMARVSYASGIKSLMYAMFRKYPDICFSVGISNRFQGSPRHDHGKKSKGFTIISIERWTTCLLSKGRHTFMQLC